MEEERQMCLTTDSGANIVKAVQLNDWRRLQCFGHRLHLAIVLHLFNETILAEGVNYTQLTKDMKKPILAYLNEYSDPGTDDLLDMASLLDPCFKTTYIKNEKVDDIKARAAEEIKSADRATGRHHRHFISSPDAKGCSSSSS
ncbi:hypothetical protein N1851_034887 [Merluccius polli]|uniref:Zinc finger BED domain-containing 1-like protein n=1 Tax=Merluccius polli TaxID=89951 RepID=A0AA47LZ34_MERPO|nr:hypothetical protein N1851_034887 [Merluccius polli]